MYLDNFADRADITREFQVDESELADATVIFAAYTYEDYSGSALVIFQRDGKLFEVHGSHCSCYGLEGQWDPEETSMEALRMREVASYGFSGDLEDLFVDLVFEKEVLEV